VVAQLAAQRIEKPDTLDLFDAETVHGVIRGEFQTTVLNAESFESFLQIVGLKEVVVGGGTCGEPGIGIGGGDDPALPQAVAEIAGGGAGSGGLRARRACSISASWFGGAVVNKA